MVCKAIAFLLSDVFQTERSARCTNLVQVRCHGFLIEWIKEGFHRFQPIWPHSIEFQCSTCGHRGFVPNLSLIQDITGMNNMMENRWEKITGYGEHKRRRRVRKKNIPPKKQLFPLITALSVLKCNLCRAFVQMADRPREDLVQVCVERYI